MGNGSVKINIGVIIAALSLFVSTVAGWPQIKKVLFPTIPLKARIIFLVGMLLLALNLLTTLMAVNLFPFNKHEMRH